jgi:hypothetical protein
MVLQGIKITQFYRELNERNCSSKKGPELCDSCWEHTCHMSGGKCTYSFADSYIRNFEKPPFVANSTPFFDSTCGGNFEMRNALFWVIAQRVVVISNRRFGTTYQSHSQGYIFFWILER